MLELEQSGFHSLPAGCQLLCFQMILSLLFKFTFVARMLKVNKSGLLCLKVWLCFHLALGTYIYSHFSLTSQPSLTHLLILSAATEPAPVKVGVRCHTEEGVEGI